MKVIDQAAWDACERIYPQKVMNLAEALANLIETKVASGLPFYATIPSAIRTLVKSHGSIDEPIRGAIILVLTKTWVTSDRVENWELAIKKSRREWKG